MAHTFLLILVAVATMGSIYYFMVRPFLRSRPELQDVFNRIDDSEAGITKVFWNYFKGFRTLLWSRFLMISGILIPVLDQIGTIDLSAFFKEEWAKYVPIVLLFIGLITEELRKVTNGPIAVSPPDPIDPPTPPTV